MKTALITGASVGIGTELAKLISEDYDHLILVARNKKALEAVGAELKEKHKITYEALPADLSSEQGVEKLIAHLKKNKTQLDLLVNNAGFGLVGKTPELSHTEQMDMIALNVSALTRLSLFAAEQMSKNGGGGIINVASIVAFMPGPFMSVYFASKAYVLSFSQALTTELADENIKVSCICPGSTKSEFHQRSGMPITKARQAAMMEADDVARIGYEGFKAGKAIIVTGAANKLMTFLTRFLPRGLLSRLVVRFIT